MNKPSTPEQFIGKTRIIARALFPQIPRLTTAGDPLERCWMFSGPPGTGKTSLAEALAAQMSGEPIASVWNQSALGVEQINGQSCLVETVRTWKEHGWYRPMGELRVQIVDEIDAASTAACNELRSYLDKLPRRTVFLATTNKPVNQLQEQLQSRFKVQYFEPVPPEPLTQWLVGQFQLSLVVAGKLARGAKGNVRAAKADALSYLEVLAA